MRVKIQNFISNKYIKIINLGILALAILAAVFGRFFTDVIALYREHYVFEILTLFFLLEIFLLLLLRGEVKRGFTLLGEDECMREALDVVRDTKHFDILSAGLGYRKFLITELLKKGVSVRLLVYHPEFVLKPDTESSTKENIAWILNQFPEEDHNRFHFLIYKKPASIRMILAYKDRERQDISCGFAGWYTYEHIQHEPSAELRFRNPLMRNLLLHSENPEHRSLLAELKNVYDTYWLESVE